MSPSADFALFYVDDSGSQDAGYTTYSWVKINPEGWGAAEQQWLRFRRILYERHGIPTSVRLHATDLAGARGRPSLDPAWKRRTGLDVIREALDAIAGLPAITIGSVYRHTPARRGAYGKVKYELYQDMITVLNHDLLTHDSYGMIIMDGNHDAAYAGKHHGLNHDNRRVIETPCFRRAGTNQWVQIADLIAWTAYRSLQPTGGHTGIGSWYQQALGRLDINGGPIPL